MQCGQEFLLDPLDTGQDPACRQVMRLFADEVPEKQPDILTFRCDRCGRSERLISES
jgi:hypothetical protein